MLHNCLQVPVTLLLLEEELKNKEKEMYDLKHELIASQIKLENTEKNVKNLQLDANENAKKIVRLETELATVRYIFFPKIWA